MADQLGSATYVLNLDTGQFTIGSRQAQTQFDQLRAKGDAVARSSGGVSNALGGVGRTAVAVALGMGGLNIAVTGAKTALEGTVQAAAEDAASQARLQAAVAATGASYADYSRQLDEVIAKGQQRGFSDDQTRSGLAILIAQTDSVTEATKRYTIAQDLARGANIDIVTASRLLGKITDENVSALQRYGIAIQKGASETEALAAVQRKFAGQADAFANSTAGQFARTTDAISEAGESIGRVLLPSVAAATEGVAGAARNTEILAGHLSAAGQVTGNVFPSLVTGAVAFGAALAAIKITEFVGGLQAAVTEGLALQRALATSSFALPAGSNVPGTGTAQLTAAAITKSLITPQVAVIGFTAAIVAADIASRKLTGSGLIDWLDGSAQAARRAEAAEKKYGDSIDFVNQLVTEGVAPGAARNIGLEKAINDAVAAQQAGIAKLRGAAKEAATTDLSGFLGKLGGETAKNLVSSLVGGDEAVKKLADNIRANNPTYQEWLEILKQIPILQTEVSGDVDTARKAYEAAGNAVDHYAISLSTLTTAQKDFASALSDLTSFATFLDPATERLKLQKIVLEQLKTQMGDTFGDANQALLDETGRRIDLLTGKQDELKQALTVVASAVQAGIVDPFQRAGESADDFAARMKSEMATASEQVQRVALALAGLPVETRLKIALALPDLEMSRLLRFISYIQQGFTVDVALRVASFTPQEQDVGPGGVLPGLGSGPVPGQQQQHENAVAQAERDIAAAVDKWTAAANANVGPLGPIAGPEDKAKAPKELSQADQDLLALAAAFAKFHAETGGTLRDFMVFLRVEAQRKELIDKLTDSSIALSAAQQEQGDGQIRLLQIGQKLADDQLAQIERQVTATAALAAAQIEEADASYRLRDIAAKFADDQLSLIQREQAARTALAARELEAADANYQLRTAFVEIEEAALSAGTSIPEQVAKIFGSIVDNAQSALDALLNKPTREGTELQLRIDLLQRQADLLIRGGADVSKAGKPGGSAADKQLKAIEDQIKALEQEKKIRADDLAIMRDHAILANQQLDTDRKIVDAYNFLVTVINNVSGALGRMINPLEAFARPGGGGGFSDQEKAYIDAVARLKGEPEPFPGYAAGTPFVPETGLALVHEGERIIAADVNRLLSPAMGPPLRLDAGLEGMNFATPRFAAPETAGRGGEGPAEIHIHQQYVLHADISDAAVDKLQRKIEESNRRSIRRIRRGGLLPPQGSNR